MHDTKIYLVTQWAVDVLTGFGWREIASVTRYRVAAQLAQGLLEDGYRGCRVRDLTTGKIPFSVER